VINGRVAVEKVSGGLVITGQNDNLEITVTQLGECVIPARPWFVAHDDDALRTTVTADDDRKLADISCLCGSHHDLLANRPPQLREEIQISDENASTLDDSLDTSRVARELRDPLCVLVGTSI
jgi:hypothetical protein